MKRFKKGDRVRYIPSHARGNHSHEDHEDGVVSSEGTVDDFVFVKYDNKMCTMVTGDEPYTAQLTCIRDLKRN